MINQLRNGKPTYYDTVDGEPFVISEYPEIKLFSSKSLKNGLYIISEVETGMQVGDEFRQLKAAEIGIGLLIRKKGIEAFRKVITENKMPEVKVREK